MLTDKRRPALLQARRVPVRPDRALRCTGSGTSNYPSARRVCVRPPRGVRLFQKGRQLFQNRHPPRQTGSIRDESPLLGSIPNLDQTGQRILGISNGHDSNASYVGSLPAGTGKPLLATKRPKTTDVFLCLFVAVTLRRAT